uniref:Uncharacterized protein n=1 Tax=Picea glauca TaxID=3330 RepID=A0A101M0W0_PICGL|nr:hypothetical protein ABT39_MTgene4291 [Picea glauca]
MLLPSMQDPTIWNLEPKESIAAKSSLLSYHTRSYSFPQTIISFAIDFIKSFHREQLPRTSEKVGRGCTFISRESPC